MAYAWLPGSRRVRAATDGGTLGGGVPRAVWLTLEGLASGISVQSAAERLIIEERPCHLVWDPATGEMAQLISVLRAGRALGGPDRLERTPGYAGNRPAPRVNGQGRICVQIGVLATADRPFTGGPLTGADIIVSWLDGWGVARWWPAGQPGGTWAAPAARDGDASPAADAALWARGGHFGASQVPGCEHGGPGAIDIDRLTGSRGRPATARGRSAGWPPSALAVSA